MNQVKLFGFHIQTAHLPPLMPPRRRSGEMSSASRATTATAQYTGSRGGPASAAALSNAEFEALIGPKPSQRSHVPPSLISPQTSRTPTQPPHHSSSQHPPQSTATTTTPSKPIDNSSSHRPSNLDISKESRNTRKDLLRESFFPDWKNDAASAGLANPD